VCGPAAGGRFLAERPGGGATHEAFLDELQERTFLFFWERADPATGLVDDRWPTRDFASIAATGFGLTAYPIGVERGWVSRDAARGRVLATLRFLMEAPQGPEPAGMAGHQGFFYHFLDPATGERHETVELSTIDTALLLGGVLFCRGYFDGDHPRRRRRSGAWRRALRPGRLDLGAAQPAGHQPRLEAGGRLPRLRLAGLQRVDAALPPGARLAEPPDRRGAWDAWTSGYRWAPFQGYEYVAFAPLFGHQYSHVWVDFRGIQDAYMRRRGIDYFENSRRATLAQRAWAIDNPRGWLGLGPDVWGITASDGPADVELPFRGETREFFTYAGRGVGADFIRDDGTIAPTAAGGSVPFAPEVAIPALLEMRRRWGEHLWGQYGFLDAFNPSFDFDVPVRHGKVVPGEGWFDTDYLGIDQGTILAMVENHRSGLIWRVMRGDPDLRRGLERAGFSGGWLEE
jgi:hypothetical protein